MNNLIAISGKIGSGKDTLGEAIRFIWDIKNAESGHYLEIDDFIAAPSDVDSSNPYQIKKFAGKLKDIACLILGCTRGQLEDREFKTKELGPEWWHYKTSNGLVNYADYEAMRPLVEFEHDVELIKTTPRKLLQLLGTEAGRQIIHPNIWVNALFSNYSDRQFRGSSYESQKSKWIITDCRFPNEAQAVKDRGGIVIRVNRPMGLLHEAKKGEFKVTNEGLVPTKDNPDHLSETALDDYDGFDYVIDNNGSIEDLIEKVKQLNLV